MMKNILLLLLLLSSFGSINSQIIELKDVWIEGFQQQRNGVMSYKPLNIAFKFSAINSTETPLLIGTHSLPNTNEEVHLGYFEIKMKTGEILKLKSKHQLVCVPTNCDINIIADLCDFCLDCSDCNYIQQFDSFSQLCDCIISSRIAYIRIEKGYEYTKKCNEKFNSQDVVMNKYFISFSVGEQPIHYYFIEGGVGKKISP